jgi:HEAT repeat protein
MTPQEIVAMNVPTIAPFPHYRANREAVLERLKAGDFHERWDAVKLISGWGDEAIAPLLSLLETDDSELQWFIVRILGNLQNPIVLPTLVALIRENRAEVSAMAAGVLSGFGEVAIAPLAALLDDAPMRLAVQALAQIHHPDVIPLLLQRVEDVEVRSVVIEALGHFHQVPEIPPVLLAALRDPVAAVRRAAVVGLGFQDCQADWVERLQPLLQDLNVEVAQQTAIALGRIGTPEAVAVLNQALPSAHPALEVEIIRAIARVGTDLEGLRVYLQRAEGAGRQEAIAVLGRVEPEPAQARAAEILLELLAAQPEARQKQAIAFSLGQLGRGEAVEAVIQLLADEQDSVKFHAIAALKQFPLVRQRLVEMQGESLSPALRQGVAMALREWGDGEAAE